MESAFKIPEIPANAEPTPVPTRRTRASAPFLSRDELKEAVGVFGLVPKPLRPIQEGAGAEGAADNRKGKKLLLSARLVTSVDLNAAIRARAEAEEQGGQGRGGRGGRGAGGRGGRGAGRGGRGAGKRGSAAAVQHQSAKRQASDSESSGEEEEEEEVIPMKNQAKRLRGTSH